MYTTSSSRYYVENARDPSSPCRQFTRVFSDLWITLNPNVFVQTQDLETQKMAGCCHSLVTHWLWHYDLVIETSILNRTLWNFRKNSQDLGKKVPVVQAAINFKPQTFKKKSNINSLNFELFFCQGKAVNFNSYYAICRCSHGCRKKLAQKLLHVCHTNWHCSLTLKPVFSSLL